MLLISDFFSHSGRGPTFKTHIMWFVGFPRSPSEIWDVNAFRSGFGGGITEWHDATPCCRIIHILVEWETIAQTIYQSPVHDEIHAAVSAHALCNLPDVFHNVGGVLCFEGFLIFGLQPAMTFGDALW
jgi:hypothetical protein